MSDVTLGELFDAGETALYQRTLQKVMTKVLPEFVRLLKDEIAMGNFPINFKYKRLTEAEQRMLQRQMQEQGLLISRIEPANDIAMSYYYIERFRRK